MRKEKGALGEKISEEFLKSNGYKILCRNWTCHWGELDLVARYKDTLVFVEVKYRSSLGYGRGEESVNFTKRAHLKRSIMVFLSAYTGNLSQYRFDVICLSPEGKSMGLRHYKNVSLS